MTTIEQTDKSLKKASGAGELENGNLPPIRTMTANSEVPSVKVCLTTASPSGGWLAGTSRSFHYWQAQARWRLLLFLAAQPLAPM